MAYLRDAKVVSIGKFLNVVTHGLSLAGGRRKDVIYEWLLVLAGLLMQKLFA